ncbi:MAG TPA: YceI family protein [Casimicrobiaceae bacterium]
MTSGSPFPSRLTASRTRRCARALAATALTLGVLAYASVASAGAETYRIDPDQSSTEFAVTNLGTARQRGHFGHTEGTIVLDSEEHTGDVNLVIDATSVDTGWGLRDAWLRGEDMFDVVHFPVMRFNSTQLVFKQDELIGISGLLTLRNVTRPVNLKIEHMQCGREPDGRRETCGAGAVSTIKRSDFGLTRVLGWVSDDIDLTFQVNAFRVPAGDTRAAVPR